jgi:hypothetical protein
MTFMTEMRCTCVPFLNSLFRRVVLTNRCWPSPILTRPMNSGHNRKKINCSKHRKGIYISLCCREKGNTGTISHPSRPFTPLGPKCQCSSPIFLQDANWCVSARLSYRIFMVERVKHFPVFFLTRGLKKSSRRSSKLSRPTNSGP